jgi:Spy/CpxP family protein refolding chaperone
MKKIFLTLVALMALTVAQAQNENGERRGPRQMDPQEMMANMEKELDLNADQKAKFADIMKEQQAEMKRHQEELKKFDEKMKNVLTDEQYKKWQHMNGRRMGMGGMRGGQGGPGGPRPGWQLPPKKDQ